MKRRGFPGGSASTYTLCCHFGNIVEVRIVSEKALRNFVSKHSDAAASLAGWRTIVRRADRKNGVDVTATFSNSDQVGEKTIFNIAQNRYRLIAFISFRARKVFIKAILTHKEYEKGDFTK